MYVLQSVTRFEEVTYSRFPTTNCEQVHMKSSLLSYFISLVNIPLSQIDLTSSSQHSAIQDNDSDFTSCVPF